KEQSVDQIDLPLRHMGNILVHSHVVIDFLLILMDQHREYIQDKYSVGVVCKRRIFCKVPGKTEDACHGENPQMEIKKRMTAVKLIEFIQHLIQCVTPPIGQLQHVGSGQAEIPYLYAEGQSTETPQTDGRAGQTPEEDFYFANRRSADTDQSCGCRTILP